MTRLDQKLYDAAIDLADRVRVERVTIGPGYTAVITSNGGAGIAATARSRDGALPGNLNMIDYENMPTMDLLQGILSSDPMLRTVALALINALNNTRAMAFAEDSQSRALLDRFDILGGRRVAMVGYFPPLVRMLEEKRVPLSVIDNARGIGNKEIFYRDLSDWAEVLILTATSITNRTMEEILDNTGAGVRTVVLGPTTPMLPEAFDRLPVHMLAGSAITDAGEALKAVRHGGEGMRALRPFTRKVYWCAET